MKTIALSTLAAALLGASGIAQEIQAFPMNDERKLTGLFFWDGAGSPGAFAIAYGQPEWKAEYDEMVASKKAGAVRLGKNYWTTLDTSIDLTIGGTKVSAGHYYLGVHRDEKGTFHLMCMDSAAARAQKAAPHMTPQMKAKINAPLQHTEVQDEADLLSITVEPGEKATEGTLSIHWGKHQLTATVSADLSSKTTPANAVKEAKETAGKGLESLKGK
jgi:hypothetical protein